MGACATHCPKTLITIFFLKTSIQCIVHLWYIRPVETPFLGSIRCIEPHYPSKSEFLTSMIHYQEHSTFTHAKDNSMLSSFMSQHPSHFSFITALTTCRVTFVLKYYCKTYKGLVSSFLLHSSHCNLIFHIAMFFKYNFSMFSIVENISIYCPILFVTVCLV